MQACQVNCQYLIPLIKQCTWCYLHTKTILLGALWAEITRLSWRRDRCLATCGSLNIDIERVLIDPSRFFNSNLYQRLHTLHPFGMSLEVLLFTFCPLSGIILDGIHKNFKVMFPVDGLRLMIFRPSLNNFPALSWREQVPFQWDNVVRFVLDQQA